MTKSELIERVAHKLRISSARAEHVVNTIFSSMEASLARGDRIEVRGFGSFEIRHYDGYAGRNPRTGDAVEVRPKRLPFFKASKEMKERLGGAERRKAAAGRKSAAG